MKQFSFATVALISLCCFSVSAAQSLEAVEGVEAQPVVSEEGGAPAPVDLSVAEPTPSEPIETAPVAEASQSLESVPPQPVVAPQSQPEVAAAPEAQPEADPSQVGYLLPSGEVVYFLPKGAIIIVPTEEKPKKGYVSFFPISLLSSFSFPVGSFADGDANGMGAHVKLIDLSYLFTEHFGISTAVTGLVHPITLSGPIGGAVKSDNPMFSASTMLFGPYFNLADQSRKHNLDARAVIGYATTSLLDGSSRYDIDASLAWGLGAAYRMNFTRWALVFGADYLRVEQPGTLRATVISSLFDVSTVEHKFGTVSALSVGMSIAYLLR